RAALMKARPVPEFTREITAQPTASPSLSPGAQMHGGDNGEFTLQPQMQPPANERLQFGGEPIAVEANAAISGFGPVGAPTLMHSANGHADTCGNILQDEPQAVVDQQALASLKPLGQVRDSFILAVNADGLWIIDQHVAHERVLF